jgi:ribonuclease-3
MKPIKSTGLPLSRERKKRLALFCAGHSLKIKRYDLLNTAFTHSSVVNELRSRNEADGIPDNERLEFLGDAILGAVAGDLLFTSLGGLPEGELARIKAVIVSEAILCGIARELQIDSLLLLSKGEDQSGGRAKNAILADSLEALIGAIYLDQGFSAAFNFIKPFLSKEISRVHDEGYHKDYKSLLQIYCQRAYKKFPEYACIKKSGPDHDRYFWAEVKVGGTTFGPSVGKNKKSAEQYVARLALEALD